MTKTLTKIELAIALLTAFAAAAFAQDAKSDVRPQHAQQTRANQAQDARGNMLRQLGLSREQIQSLRRVNAERKPLMEEAQLRLRATTRSLDDAIYADEVNESDVQARLKDLQHAQAEVFRVRTSNELAVRRLLTPDQLVRFRVMRQRFEQGRGNGAGPRRANGEMPNRNLNQFNSPKPPAKPEVKPGKTPQP